MVCYSNFLVHVRVASKSNTFLEKAVFHAEKMHTLFDGSINTSHHAYLSTVDNGSYILREMLSLLLFPYQKKPTKDAKKFELH